jgi:RHS repeat-associated protein
MADNYIPRKDSEFNVWVTNYTHRVQQNCSGTAPGRFTGTSVTLYGRGEAVAVSRSSSAGSRGGPAYLGKDVLGSVKTETNEYGVLEERYKYDAFGKPYKGDLTSGMNLGYTGKPYDTATGLYNYGYRDYKPEAARFTTIDPVRDGANWFAYVNNAPVNWVDPDGLLPSLSDTSVCFPPSAFPLPLYPTTTRPLLQSFLTVSSLKTSGGKKGK